MLVFISIIAILASLAFPAIGGAMDSAKKTTAKNAAVQIANAVAAYETEYGKLPLTNATSASKAMMDILTGINTNSDANPRGIVFMEATEWRKGKGGTNDNGYCDPWTSGVAYSMALDADYDNIITAGTNGQSLRKKVGVWNVPGAANSRRYVNSWE